MSVLVVALYAEGSTDDRFLPPIIQRTAESIIAQYGQNVVDVLEPVIVPSQPHQHREECILSAACYAHGYHALIVHSDADDRTPDRALLERIQPGFDLVARTDQEACKHLIPVIPVQMIEAWMLADHSALCEVIGTNLSPQILGLPSRSAEVERDANPKQTLKEVIQKALSHRPQRRRQLDFTTRQESLARRINLNTLYSVPSYREFFINFKKTLAELNFIPWNHLEE
jgi:hypothetical protein